MEPLNEFDSIWHLLTEGSPSVVSKHIKNGGEYNIQDKEGNNVLFDANTNLIPFLIEAGLDINHTNIYGKNALFDAPFDKTKVLIEHGININQLSNENENALFYWNDSRRGEYDKFKLLIENGINYNQINIYNEHVLFLANSWLTDFLLFHKEAKLNVNLLNSDGNHCMSAYFDNDMYQKLFLLVKAGFNIDHINFSDKYIKESQYYDFFLKKKFENDALKEKQVLSHLITGDSIDYNHIKKRI